MNDKTPDPDTGNRKRIGRALDVPSETLRTGLPEPGAGASGRAFVRDVEPGQRDADPPDAETGRVLPRRRDGPRG